MTKQSQGIATPAFGRLAMTKRKKLSGGTLPFLELGGSRPKAVEGGCFPLQYLKTKGKREAVCSAKVLLRGQSIVKRNHTYWFSVLKRKIKTQPSGES